MVLWALSPSVPPFGPAASSAQLPTRKFRITQREQGHAWGLRSYWKRVGEVFCRKASWSCLRRLAPLPVVQLTMSQHLGVVRLGVTMKAKVKTRRGGARRKKKKTMKTK